MSSPVVEWQIIAPQPEQVVSFYRAVFGWQSSTQNALGYRRVDTGAGGTPGGVWPAPPGQAAFVQLFIRVDDVSQAVARAVEHGASVVVPRSVLPDGAIMAVLHDPAGIPFGLVEAPRGSD